MAHWVISEHGDRLDLTYEPSERRHLAFRCGQTPPGTPVADVIEWVLRFGLTQPKDLIVLPDGLLVPVTPLAIA